jgi:uncharacterized protein YkwD
MGRWTRTFLLAGLAVVALAIPAAASAADQYAGLLAPESACPGQTDPSLSTAAKEQAMVCMHRYARSHAGAGGIHSIRSLRSSSGHKARDIRRCGQFSHYACGRDAFYWFQRVGFFRGTYGGGENLALTYGANSTVRDAMDLWLNSDEHRHVLLTRDYDDIGVSVVSGHFDGQGDATIWVAHFGYHH